MSRLTSCLLVFALAACGDDKDGDYYADCAVADDCELPDDAPEDAELACLVSSDVGICSHTCDEDSDCGDEELCSPFESEDEQYCFLSCEEIPDDQTEEEVCGDNATCRSTGGGSDNRKICFPGS